MIYAEVYGERLRDFYKITKAQVKAEVPFFDRRFYRVVRVAVRGAGLGVGPRGVPDRGARLDSLESIRAGCDTSGKHHRRHRVGGPAGGAVHCYRHGGGGASAGCAPTARLDCWGIDGAGKQSTTAGTLRHQPDHRGHDAVDRHTPPMTRPTGPTTHRPREAAGRGRGDDSLNGGGENDTLWGGSGVRHPRGSRRRGHPAGRTGGRHAQRRQR